MTASGHASIIVYDMEMPFEKAMLKKWVLWYPAVLFLAVAVHLPSLWIPFQFDDFHHINENPAVESLSNISAFFKDPSLFSGRSGEGMYRPVLMITHALTYAVSGSNPMAFRALNLALHIFNSLLVLSLLWRWTGSWNKAGAGATFWSVAAIQHISAGYISARSTLLSVFFMLIALLVTTGERKKMPAYAQGILLAVLYMIALLSKEIAYILPLLVIFYDVSWGRQKGVRLRSRWQVYFPSVIIMAAYPFFRFIIFDNPFSSGPVSHVSYLLTQPEVFFYYLSKTFFPVNLTLMLDKPLVDDPFNFTTMASLLGIFFVLLFALLSLRKSPQVGFGILFVIICLLPTSSLVPLFLVASIERMYLPLLGIIVVLIFFSDMFFKDEGFKKQVALVLFCAVVGMNAAITVKRHLVWQSGVELMRDMISKAPEKSTPWTWLGSMEMEEERYADAREHLFQALRINPHDSVAHQTLGDVDLLEGKYEKAAVQLRMLCLADAAPQGIRVSSCVKLAMAYLKQDKVEKARKFSMMAIDMEKRSPDAHYILGRVYHRRGKKDKAKEHYQKALSIRPDSPDVKTQLGILARERGDLETAREYLTGVVEKGLEWSEVYFHLGMLEGEEGNLEKSRQWFEKGIEIAPEDPYPYYGMGIYHASASRLEKANDFFKKAIKREPEFAEARDFLAKTYLDLSRQRSTSPSRRGNYLRRAAEQIKWLLEHGKGEARKREWEKTAGRPLP